MGELATESRDRGPHGLQGGEVLWKLGETRFPPKPLSTGSRALAPRSCNLQVLWVA